MPPPAARFLLAAALLVGPLVGSGGGFRSRDDDGERVTLLRRRLPYVDDLAIWTLEQIVHDVKCFLADDQDAFAGVEANDSRHVEDVDDRVALLQLPHDLPVFVLECVVRVRVVWILDQFEVVLGCHTLLIRRHDAPPGVFPHPGNVFAAASAQSAVRYSGGRGQGNPLARNVTDGCVQPQAGAGDAVSGPTLRLKLLVLGWVVRKKTEPHSIPTLRPVQLPLDVLWLTEHGTWASEFALHLGKSSGHVRIVVVLVLQ